MDGHDLGVGAEGSAHVTLWQRFLALFACEHDLAPLDRKCLKCGAVVDHLFSVEEYDALLTENKALRERLVGGDSTGKRLR